MKITNTYNCLKNKVNDRKKIIFRADGDNNMGLGHLFRIFALIEMYKGKYDFLLLTKETTVKNVIPKEYLLEIIPENIKSKDEPNWIAERYSSSEYIIIADGYQFNSEYQKNIKNKGYFLVYIDDLASEYMYADFVINHSPHIKKEDFKSESYTQFALGTAYAMLRPAFLEEAKKERKIDKIDTAFICFGGSDIYDLTYKATVAALSFNHIKEVNVVLGGAYNHQDIFKIKDIRLQFYKNLSEKKMLSLMKKCDFAIAPASTILYELCCIKMPILSGFYVDNQENIYKAMEDEQLVYGMGNIEKFTKDDFERHFENIQEINVQIMLLKQRVAFDGKSKKRFLDLLKDY